MDSAQASFYHTTTQASITPTAVEVLRAERKAQLAARLTYGELWQDHDLIFTRNAGQHLSHGVVRYHWAHLLKTHGLPRIRPHDLRHSFTTLLLGQGVSMKTVSKMLGHSDVTITMRTYAHVTDDMQEHAVDAMEEIMWRAKGNSEPEGERRKEGENGAN